MSAIDRLYGRFASMYMHKWSSHFTSPTVITDWKNAWSSALIAEGITPRQSAEGIERCRSEYPTWPPSEGQFIALCKPPMDYEEEFTDAAFQMMKRQQNNPKEPAKWRYPALYWAAVDFGGDLRTMSYSQAATRWKRLLDKRRQSECEPVPNFALQLAAPPRNADGVAITSDEAKAEARAALRAMLTRKPSPEVAATKAREVLARHEAGEAVLPYLLSHAREVLALLADPTTAPDDENI